MTIFSTHSPARILPFATRSLALLALSLSCAAGAGACPVDHEALPKDDPRQWAVEAARNEVPVVEHQGSLLRYHLHMVDAKGDMLRDTVESRDGSVHRLIARDGRPLTPEEDREEVARLQAELDSPADFAKHIRSEQSGKKMAVELIKLLPDAMLYTYVPDQPQRAGVSTGEHPDIVLDFKPKPGWTPPTLASQALTGIEGRMWIDRATHRLTRFEGNIFRPVNLGLGVLAHIFPGGKLAVDQVNFDDRLIVTHYTQQFVVRALMVKTIRDNSQIDTTQVTKINPMTYQEAIRLLLATPVPR